MMNKKLFCPAFIVLALAAPGCVLPSSSADLPMGLSSVHTAMSSETVIPRAGLIYTHKVIPLDLNAYRTQRVETMSKGDIKHFQYYIDFRWDSNAIGDLAEKAGIEYLHYADLEILSVLGIWRQYWVHLYGTTKEQQEESGQPARNFPEDIVG
jgi:hypothetical protein